MWSRSVHCTETVTESLIVMLTQTVHCKLCVEKKIVSITWESFTTAVLVAILKRSPEETVPLSVRPTAFDRATLTGRIFVKFHTRIFCYVLLVISDLG